MNVETAYTQDYSEDYVVETIDVILTRISLYCTERYQSQQTFRITTQLCTEAVFSLCSLAAINSPPLSSLDTNDLGIGSEPEPCEIDTRAFGVVMVRHPKKHTKMVNETTELIPEIYHNYISKQQDFRKHDESNHCKVTRTDEETQWLELDDAQFRRQVEKELDDRQVEQQKEQTLTDFIESGLSATTFPELADKKRDFMDRAFYNAPAKDIRGQFEVVVHNDETFMVGHGDKVVSQRLFTSVERERMPKIVPLLMSPQKEQELDKVSPVKKTRGDSPAKTRKSKKNSTSNNAKKNLRDTRVHYHPSSSISIGRALLKPSESISKGVVIKRGEEIRQGPEWSLDTERMSPSRGSGGLVHINAALNEAVEADGDTSTFPIQDPFSRAIYTPMATPMRGSRPKSLSMARIRTASGLYRSKKASRYLQPLPLGSSTLRSSTECESPTRYLREFPHPSPGRIQRVEKSDEFVQSVNKKHIAQL